MTNLARSIRKRIDRLKGKEPGWFLKGARGVVHIGANTGQERDVYAKYNLDVLWVEPIDSVFDELTANIAPFPKQTALKALLTDQTGDKVTLNIASNNGASSSILPMKQHSEIWPTVHYVNAIEMTSETLPDLLARAQIDPHKYDALVMDTQGSELLVLRGAASLLKNFNIIHTEVADFESYEGCCVLSDIDGFLREHGFVELYRARMAGNRKGGTYYDVTYKRA